MFVLSERPFWVRWLLRRSFKFMAQTTGSVGSAQFDTPAELGYEFDIDDMPSFLIILKVRASFCLFHLI